MNPPLESSQPRILGYALSATAMAYAIVGLGMMLFASLTVPYADQYRFLVNHLTNAFPANIFIADNGHREVFPNVVRVADTIWWDANQWLQIAAGIGLALLALFVLLRGFRGESRDTRRVVAAVCCVGIFWLGNYRKLTHCNASVNLFFMLLWLCLGLRALSGQDRDGGNARSWLAAATGLAATMTFGSGPACFLAFFVILALQRAPWRQWLPLVIAAGVGAVALFFAGEGGTGGITLRPAAQCEQLLRWLGGPFVWILSPLLEVKEADKLPTELLSSTCAFVAGKAEAAFGNRETALWPSAGLGAFGVLWLLIGTLRHVFTRPSSVARQIALGLAWFGLGTGILVVLARPDYFVGRPDQVPATRYLPWSMIFWTGLVLGLVVGSGAKYRLTPWLVLALAVLFAPSQAWSARSAFRMKRVAEFTATGAAVGVLSRDQNLGETEPKDLLHATPVLRERSKAMFAWPETGLLGQVPPPTQIKILPANNLTVRRVQNWFGTPGSEARFKLDDPGADRLLILDEKGTVCGLAALNVVAGEWHGWLRGHPEAANLRIAVFELFR